MTRDDGAEHRFRRAVPGRRSPPGRCSLGSLGAEEVARRRAWPTVTVGRSGAFGPDRTRANRAISVIPPWFDRCMFDVLVDELRTHSTEWLRRERRRGGRAAAEPAHAGRWRCCGCSTSAVRSTARSARRASRRGWCATRWRRRGRWSRCRRSVGGDRGWTVRRAVDRRWCSLADEESDREWAARAPNVDPIELARLVRQRGEADGGGFAGAVRGA